MVYRYASILRSSRLARLIAASLLALAWATAAALPRNPHFGSLGVSQGLPQESVLAMAQDRQGFMWIGTQGGLSRYDGYRFINYRSDSKIPTSLADDRVNALLSDEQGRLWVGTRGGLQRFDAQTDGFIRYQPPGADLQHPAAVDIRALAGDGHGGLWIATRYGLQHFDPASGRFKVWRHDPAQSGSLIDDEVWALTQDASGALWVGTEGGLDRLSPGTDRFEHYRLDDAAKPDPKRNAVWALSADDDGGLWVGNYNGVEVWHFAGGQLQRRVFTPANDIQPDTITSILRDAAGRHWLGSFTQGLLLWDEGADRFISYRNHPGDPSSLASNDVQSLYIGRDGCLWVGTWNEGISKVDLASASFERYVHIADSNTGLSDNRVGSVAGNPDGIWIATQSGLDRLDRDSGSITTFRHDPSDTGSISGDEVHSVFVDSAQQLWAGTAHGLNRYDGLNHRFSVHHFAAGGSGDDAIFFIGESPDHKLWLGSHDALHEFDPVNGNTRSFHHDPADSGSIGEGVVRKVLQDRRGNIWVATAGGLDRFDRKRGRFAHFRHDPADPQSLVDNHVGDLFEDRHGDIWVGTAAGLDRLQIAPDGTARFQAFTTHEGLANDLIGGIEQDDSGALWISTAAGLSRLDPITQRFRNYGADDGLLNGTYLIASSYRDRDDTLYFGNFHGLTAFRPDAVKENAIPPAVAITDVQIFGRSLTHGPLPDDVRLDRPLPNAAAIVLPYADNVFSLEFSALHFADPQRNRYRYRLEGFDSDWTAIDASRRFVTYTHLDPGHYVFRVLASNKNDVWNDTGAALGITIIPPFWMTWWFRAFAVALVTCAGLLAYRARIARIARRQRELEQEVATRTAEVVQQKAVAEQQRSEAVHQRGEAEAQKERVETAHRNIALVSEIGRELTAKLDQEAIMQTLYGHVDKLMVADVFGIGLYHPEKELIEFPLTLSKGRRYAPYTRSMGDPYQLAVWCVQHRSEIVINDIATDAPRYTTDLQKTIAAQHLARLENGSEPEPPQSMIYMPLQVEDRVLGIVTAQAFGANAYQPQHVDILRTLSSYCAVALDNAHAYRRLQEMQKQLVLQEKMASLGRLVAGVAHEVNTPLGNIRMSVSIILQHVEALARRLQRGELQKSSLESFLDTVRLSGSLIDGSASRVDELITTFKQLSMDPANQRLRRFNATETLDLIVESLRPHLRTAGAEIEVRADADLQLLGDPVRFEQVVANLLTNAIRHGLEGRQDGRIVVALQCGESTVDLSVSDNGVGIPVELRDKVFEPFVTTKFGQGHSGLGLYLVHSVVTGIFQGTITVESDVGRGTVFRIQLPRFPISGTAVP